MKILYMILLAWPEVRYFGRRDRESATWFKTSRVLGGEVCTTWINPVSGDCFLWWILLGAFVKTRAGLASVWSRKLFNRTGKRDMEETCAMSWHLAPIILYDSTVCNKYMYKPYIMQWYIVICDHLSSSPLAHKKIQTVIFFGEVSARFGNDSLHQLEVTSLSLLLSGWGPGEARWFWYGCSVHDMWHVYLSKWKHLLQLYVFRAKQKNPDCYQYCRSCMILLDFDLWCTACKAQSMMHSLWSIEDKGLVDAQIDGPWCEGAHCFAMLCMLLLVITL